VRRVHRTILGHRQRPDDLLHEQRLWMRRGSEDLHAAGGQVDNEPRTREDGGAWTLRVHIVSARSRR
jgi:hypothetical protein